MFAGTAEAKVLSTHQARVTLDRELARDPLLDAHRLGRCHRVTRRLIDCHAWIGGPAPEGESGYDEAWTIYRMKLKTHTVAVRFLDFVWVWV